MSDARMAVCIDSWTLRKEEEGTLGQQPNWTSVSPSQSGSHPLLGVIPRPHQRGGCSGNGACPEAGLGVASEGPQAW